LNCFGEVAGSESDEVFKYLVDIEASNSGKPFKLFGCDVYGSATEILEMKCVFAWLKGFIDLVAFDRFKLKP